MSWYHDRWLSRAIDAHVQGLNDPLAPWNQDDDVPKMCEECPEEVYDECGFSQDGDVDRACEPLKKKIEEDFKAMQEADEAMYRHWLEDLSESEAKKCDPEVYKDWLKLHGK